MKRYSFLFVLLIFGCAQRSPETVVETIAETIPVQETIQVAGSTVQTRFAVPEGYERISVEENSFGAYLRNLPLKGDGAKVHYYNGDVKPYDVHAAVVDMDTGKRDLQQCADAVMRLRAEHLYAQKDYGNIHFNFTNGDRIDYDKWRRGYRIKINGNKIDWVKSAEPSNSYASFRKYMNLIFAYAGTLSLEKELKPTDLENIEIGEVFIQGGSPGHAVIVLDVAVHAQTGERIFLLAQSYMPAQEIHILKNPMNEVQSPWYSNTAPEIITPEWRFERGDLKKF